MVDLGSDSLAEANGGDRGQQSEQATFRFIDLFAGIGGLRGGLGLAGGKCVYSVENDKYARATYEANWGPLDARDVREVDPSDIGAHEILAAGFPCQPFSLAGVVKKQSMGRAHGFEDPKSGNLFFEIVRLIGGPWNLPPSEVADEAEAPQASDGRFLLEGRPTDAMPPILLLENVRNLLSHDQGRTIKVIRRRLMRSGYRVETDVINAASWVPQNRRRTFIVALRKDLFSEPFKFPAVPSGRHGLDAASLEQDPTVLEKHRITPGTWNALIRHRERHQAAGNGFGFGIAKPGEPTRTLSARYYKDGAEILISMPDDSLPPRRLTSAECAMLMGFTEGELGRPFVIPAGVSESQAYKQFGNAVVVPQAKWLGQRLVEQYGDIFATRMVRLPSE